MKISSANILLDVSSKSFFKTPAHYEVINEYFDQEFNTGVTMGVSEAGVGIAIKEKPPHKPLTDITNPHVKKILFNSQTPSAKDLEDYLKTHNLYSSYIKKGSYHQMTLVYTLVALSKNSPKNVIDICIPEVDMNILDLEGLKKQGIAKLVLINCKNDLLNEQEFTLMRKVKCCVSFPPIL